jgi:hypothetical protein
VIKLVNVGACKMWTYFEEIALLGVLIEDSK